MWDAELCSPGAEESKAKEEKSIESHHRRLPWGVGCSLQALVWKLEIKEWECLENMPGEMFTAVTMQTNGVCILPIGFVCLIASGWFSMMIKNCKCYPPLQFIVRSQRRVMIERKSRKGVWDWWQNILFLLSFEAISNQYWTSTIT